MVIDQLSGATEGSSQMNTWPGGTDEPWSTWRSWNRLRVQKGRRRAMMKMWKLSHTDVCDCGERQTMYHLITCGDAPNCTWTDLAFPTLADVNCAKQLCQTLGGINMTVDILTLPNIPRYRKHRYRHLNVGPRCNRTGDMGKTMVILAPYWKSIWCLLTFMYFAQGL